MEGFFFLADIVLMLMLAFAIFRGENKDAPDDLGLFSYKTDAKRGGTPEQGEPDA
ncbi:MAG: hypothetical protein KGL40_02795 [Rhodocyclaceae bacterium]|nr:hypothetical protein [Rhodocyclaceae bacterium]